MHTIKVRRSAVPGKVPTLLQLNAGEFAINTADGKAYFSTGSEIIEIANSDDVQSLTGALLSLSELSTNGILAKSGSNILSRSIAGVTNEIDVNNADGTSDNPTIGLANDLVAPGVGGLTLPHGTTVQRKPAAIDGTLRYNDSLLQFEGMVNGSWEPIALDDVETAVAAIVLRSTTLSVTTTTQIIPYTTEVYNNSSYISLESSNSLQVNKSGLYLIGIAGEAIHTTTSAIMYFNINVNGTIIDEGTVTINTRSTRMPINKCLPRYLNAGDLISVTARSSTGIGTLQANFSFFITSLQGSRGPAGIPGGSTLLMYSASSLDNPNNSNWAINALAPVTQDNLEAALSVRAFDDTIEEGVGFTAYIPAGATSITFSIMYKPATNPGSAKNALLRIYTRKISIDAAITSWSSPVSIGTLPVNNNYFKSAQLSIPLSSLSIVPGDTAQFEITRNASNLGDNLVGDLYILNMQISFG